MKGNIACISAANLARVPAVSSIMFFRPKDLKACSEAHCADFKNESQKSPRVNNLAICKRISPA